MLGGGVERLRDAGPSPEALARAGERTRLVRAALARLAPRHRRLLEARYWERRTFLSIAQEFGVGEPAAQKMHARAVRALGRALATRRIRRPQDI